MAHRRFAKLGPFPRHGSYQDRYLEDRSTKEWQKSTATSSAKWLVRHPVSLPKDIPFVFLKDSHGDRYKLFQDGHIERDISGI